MYVAPSCPICHSQSNGCNCQSDLVRFVELLSSANQRVSTIQVTSPSSNKTPKAALIDKLTFDLGSPIPREEFISRINASGLKHQIKKLRDRRWYIQVGTSEVGIYGALSHYQSQHVLKLVTRPSAFAHYDEYKQRLTQILLPEEILQLRVTRLDVALDYPLDLQTTLSGLDYVHKQSKVTYQDRGGHRTGICVGTGNEKIVVYDKAAKANQDSDLTRIELQLSGTKLPARSLEGIETAILSEEWNPFKAIALNTVKITPLPNTLSTTQQERLQNLDSLLKREGLFSARRTLNEQGNFTRDYGSLFTAEPWPEQPAESFKKQIRTFFKLDPKGGSSWKLQQNKNKQAVKMVH